MKKAILTIYNPASDVVDNVKKIACQVDYVYLSDNSSVDNFSLFKEISNVKYFHNDCNLGISCAFNKILKNTNSFLCDDYIIFFDQDSNIEVGFIDKLISIYEYLESKNINIGCLGPAFVNTINNDTTLTHYKKCTEDNIYSVRSIITSSMLIKYSTLQKIDFWDESIFLDVADYAVCMKLKYHSLKCILTSRLIFQHTLGDCIENNCIKENPIREYYRSRDILKLILRKYVSFRYKCIYLYIFVKKILINLFYLKNKKEIIMYNLYGIIDFFKGKNGEFIKLK